MEKSKTQQLPIPLSKATGIFLLQSAYSQGLLIVGTVFIQEEMTLNPCLTCFSRIALEKKMRRLIFETVYVINNLEQLVLKFNKSKGAWSPLGSKVQCEASVGNLGQLDAERAVSCISIIDNPTVGQH